MEDVRPSSLLARYHFDAETGRRKRLAHCVSFPSRLELRLRREALEAPVAFECVGYLEHVSESAHSGHYRATLLREDASEPLEAAGQSRIQFRLS